MKKVFIFCVLFFTLGSYLSVFAKETFANECTGVYINSNCGFDSNSNGYFCGSNRDPYLNPNCHMDQSADPNTVYQCHGWGSSSTVRSTQNCAAQGMACQINYYSATAVDKCVPPSSTNPLYESKDQKCDNSAYKCILGAGLQCISTGQSGGLPSQACEPSGWCT